MEYEGTQPEQRSEQAEPDAIAKRLESAKGMRKRRITIFIIVSIVNVGLLGLLWSQLLIPAQKPAAQSQMQSQSQGAFFAGPLVGQTAPNFTLAELSTRSTAKLSLANFKGKPVVLNVWQSSCAPCVDEAPLFQSTWQNARSQGVVFLGMDFQDNQGDALKFVQTHGITYTNVVDQDGSVAINYGVTGTPETIFIDRHGVIVGRHAGELTATQLRQGLQLLSR